jgi:hypothetical protein
MSHEPKLIAFDARPDNRCNFNEWRLGYVIVAKAMNFAECRIDDSR